MIFCLAFALQNKSFLDGIPCLQSGSRNFLHLLLLLLLLRLLSLNLLQSSGICPSVLLSEGKVEGLTLSPSVLAPLVLIHILSIGLCCDTPFMPCGRSYSPHRHRQKRRTRGKTCKIVLLPFNGRAKRQINTDAHTCRGRRPPQLQPLVRRRLLILCHMRRL